MLTTRFSYYNRRKNGIRCRTILTPVHFILEKFFRRIRHFDYSTENTILVVSRIQTGSNNHFVDISYTHYKLLDEIPKTEINIVLPNKRIKYVENHNNIEFKDRFEVSIEDEEIM
jgi:hypothetical protein